MVTELGNHLRQARANCGKTQKEVAREMDVSFQTVSQWETGTAMPPTHRLEDLAKAYDVNYDECFCWLGQEEESLPEHDAEGVPHICRVLNFYAREAQAKTGIRWIIHSLSDRGFLTSEDQDLGKAVCNCAASGVDIVFFALPGPEKPNLVCSKLKESLEEVVVTYFPENQETIRDHVWVALPCEEPDDPGMTGWILGMFVRVIAVILATQKVDGDQQPISDLSRVFPARDDVERFWVDLEWVSKAGLTGPRWVPFSASGSHKRTYKRALQKYEFHVTQLLREASSTAPATAPRKRRERSGR